jgi:hypothetical protein
MRKLVYLGVTAAAALLTTLAATPAMADTGAVLTVGAVGGTNAAVGDTIDAALQSGGAATFHSAAGGTTGVSCATSAFSTAVTDNPTAPGAATETLGTQTFADCTANVPGVTGVSSVVVDNLPYTTTVDSAGVVTVSGSDTVLIQTTIKLRTLLGTVTCVYRANGNVVTGVASNADNSISFTDQQFNKFSGPGTCFANGFFTAKYAPITDTTQAASVFVN